MRRLGVFVAVAVLVTAVALPAAAARRDETSTTAWARKADAICAAGIVEGKRVAAATPSADASRAEFLAFMRKAYTVHDKYYARLQGVPAAPAERARVAAMLALYRKAIAFDKAGVAAVASKWGDYQTFAKWAFASAGNWARTRKAALAAGARTCARYFSGATYAK